MDEIERHVLNLKKLIEERDYAGLESYLIEKYEPNPNTWDYKIGWCRHITLINIAAKQRDAKAVELLISHHADNFADDKGASLTSEDRLFLAPFYTNENDPQNYKKRFLLVAGILQGSLAEIKYWHEERKLFCELTSVNGNPSLFGNPLGQCCYFGYNDCVEYLVTKVGCDVNQEFFYQTHYSPLLAALLNNHISTADLLVKLGADVHRDLPERIAFNNTIQCSLIHHMCRIQHHGNKNAEQEIKRRVEGCKWLLAQGIDYDKNTVISDDYADDASTPALVVACRSTPELVELLIENQRDKWQNNGGPLLEVIPRKNIHVKYTSDPIIDFKDRLIAVVQLILPLVDPAKKDEHLANALAAAILREDVQYEDYLKNSLGADLKFMTKKEKYYHRQGRLFEVRMKLARNGIDFFTEQNQTKDYMVSRVDIPTKTAKLENIRKKMKNIKENSEIFYEVDAFNSDPKANTWRTIKFKYNEYPKFDQLLLLDKDSNLIYKGVREIEDLIFLTHGQRQFAFFGAPAFYNRFAVFALATPNDERNIVLPRGYRIMFKPVSFEVGNALVLDAHQELNGQPDYEEQQNNNQINNNKEEESVDEEQEQTDRPRRSTRNAKRKLEQVESTEQTENSSASNKRRKTRK